ncbi:MAG TPA: hypothetical protein VKB51_07510 [bacterium]|nr:hypothetical protein [bacterium]
MAKDKKVISLDERRRNPPRLRPARREQPPASATMEGQAGASSDPTPLPGRLIWLYCPTCRTIEYTELDVAGGRVHNVCGSQVQEAPVELDLRAEATIAQINLERLNILESLLDGQRKRYEEYQRRLNLAAGRPLQPYATNDDSASQLPVVDVDAFGLLVSRFFDNPAAHFPDLANEGSPDAPPPGATED